MSSGNKAPSRYYNPDAYSGRYLDVLDDPLGELCTPASAPERPWTGERHLALAVLDDALRILFKYRGTVGASGADLWRTAWAWVQEEAHDVFGFDGVCAAVGIDPDFLRRGLRARFASGVVVTLARRHRARGAGVTRVTLGLGGMGKGKNRRNG